MADVKATLDALQKQLTEAQAVYTQSVTAYNNAAAAAAAAQVAAETCQNLRDQHNTGWAKNKACDIDKLSNLNQAWANAQSVMQQKAAAMNNFKAVVDAIQKKIDDVIKANEELLLTDPKYSLQVQQIKSAEAIAKAKADAEASAKKKTIIIIVAIVAVVLTVVIVSIVSYRKRNQIAAA